jgi:hypothetical protein
VLAIDATRGWLLLRDSGTMLRDLAREPRDLLTHWRRILPLYAELQIDLATRLDELLELGALDRRLAGLPRQVERLLADTAALGIGRPDGLTSEEHRRLRSLVPRVAALCREVAQAGIPESLHHDDFHDGNVFVRDGRYIFADWAESCAAHPFFTLAVALRGIAYRTGLAEDSPELSRLRDSYLEPWGRFAPYATLLAICAPARRLGMLCRALTWNWVVSHLDGPDRAENADAAPGWLRLFLRAECEAGS